MSIPKGVWEIECVLINDQTVMNNDGMRAIEILDDAWVLQPVGQRFEVFRAASKSAELKSKGENFYAKFEVSANQLTIELSRPNVKETIRIEAVAITANVFAMANMS